MNYINLSEAFKQLNLLEEENFNLKDEDSFEKVKDLLDDSENEQEDTLTIYDLDAEDDEEAKETCHLDDAILKCCVCGSMIFKDKDEVDVNMDEEFEGKVANVGDECPYCHSVDGYEICGQVAPYKPTEPEDFEETEEEEIEVEETADEEEADDKKKDESLEESVEESLEESVEESINEACEDCAACEEEPVEEKLEEELIEEELEEDDEIVEALIQEKLNALNEDVEKVNVETEDSVVTVESEDNGKVVVTTEPKGAEEDAFIPGDEMMVPADDEFVDEVEGTDDEMADFAPEDETMDLDINDFDEESFDDLGESYLKKVYENVNSFKTTAVRSDDASLMVEGLITFNSGKEKKTKFVFEAFSADKNLNVKFLGENKQISRGKKSFTLSGRLNEGKLICESLKYNYRQKLSEGTSTRVYGTVKLNESK